MYQQKFFPGNIVLHRNVVHPKGMEMKVVESWENEGHPRRLLLTELDGSGKCFPVPVDECTFVSVGVPYEFGKRTKAPVEFVDVALLAKFPKEG